MKKTLLLVSSFLLVLVFAGCQDIEMGTQSTESAKQESIQKKLLEAVPAPEITNSTTRKAIAERAKVFNEQDKITYIYLVSFGKVMAFYPVKGQVVSLRSYLTPMENIVDYKGLSCSGSPNNCNSAGYGALIVQAPDIDGTYGDNPDGVFFFTADTNAYVEWRGDYMVSDQPLKLTTQPELVREVK